jgi:curved DNA-binding protein CbpA
MRLGSEVLAADLYGILEVSERANREEIRRAWRLAAMRSHPDLAGAERERAEQLMARINVAASVLLDPERRAAYDRHWRASRVRAGTAPFWPSIEESDLEWVAPEPERKSWIPNSAELKQLLERIRPWTGRRLLEIADAAHGWPPKKHAVALAVCVVMALSLIVHAKPRSLAFLYAKPPTLGVASPKGI